MHNKKIAIEDFLKIFSDRLKKLVEVFEIWQ